MTRSSIRQAAMVTLACVLAALAFGSDLLARPFDWGRHDWDYYFFMHMAAYRSLTEFAELPLWNPWSVGGLPYMGNPQQQVCSPWFLVHLALGPVAFKLVILAHYALCLGGMVWLGRQLGLSRLATVYAAGTFTFSTWLALRVFAGHYTYLASCYLPWVLGLLHRSRRDWWAVVPGGVLVGLMVLQGLYDVLLMGMLAGTLVLGWSVRDWSVRPLVSLMLMGGLGAGLGAVKLVPVLELMRQHPRILGSSPQQLTERFQAPTSEETQSNEKLEGIGDIRVVHGSWGEGTRWEPAGILIKAFLGREQRGATKYFVRSWDWHEYGAYLGPLGVLLVVCSVLVRRDAWPWIVAAGFCFALGLGISVPFGPFRLLRFLPLFKSMHCPCRFFIPALCGGCIVAGLTLDALRERLQRGGRPSRVARVDGLMAVVVALSLLDSVVVGRYTLQGAFDRPAPTVPPRSPSLITIAGDYWHMTGPLLANQATRDGYEPLEIPIRVDAIGQPGYRGEHYFVPSAAGIASPGEDGDCQTRLEGWSPNTATVRAECAVPGLVVLNRNWDAGWRVDPPYKVVPYRGLVASAVPAGIHSIRFSYHSWAFATGLGVSLATLAAIPFAHRRARQRALASAGAGKSAGKRDRSDIGAGKRDRSDIVKLRRRLSDLHPGEAF